MCVFVYLIDVYNMTSKGGMIGRKVETLWRINYKGLFIVILFIGHIQYWNDFLSFKNCLSQYKLSENKRLSLSYNTNPVFSSNYIWTLIHWIKRNTTIMFYGLWSIKYCLSLCNWVPRSPTWQVLTPRSWTVSRRSIQ